MRYARGRCLTDVARAAGAWVVLATVVGCASKAAVAPVPSPRVDDGSRHILLVGASYFAQNEFPKTLRKLFESGGKKAVVGECIYSGRLLKNLRHEPVVMRRIREERWDEVVLCDVGPGVAYEGLTPPKYPFSDHCDTRESLVFFVDEVRKDHAKPLFIVPWAFEDGMTWVKGMTDTYEQMQALIDTNGARWAKEMGIAMAPVGPAFHEAMRRHKELHYLYASDRNHPSPRGAYLMACMLYGSLFGESAEGLCHPSTIGDEDARTLQAVAWKVVQASAKTWNLTLAKASAQPKR